LEKLKALVATLTTVLIFISAVEILAPDKKMKKYISFVLGLILISTILNPIVEFITNGENSILQGIENYETVFSKNENKINTDGATSFESTRDSEDARKKAFISNFNKNCDSMLKNKFDNMTFKSEVDCDVDFNNVKINVKNLKIGIKDKNVRKIEKVEIGKKKKDTLRDEYKDVISYAASEFDISEDKIEVYMLEE